MYSLNGSFLENDSDAFLVVNSRKCGLWQFYQLWTVRKLYYSKINIFIYHVDTLPLKETDRKYESELATADLCNCEECSFEANGTENRVRGPPIRGTNLSFFRPLKANFSRVANCSQDSIRNSFRCSIFRKAVFGMVRIKAFFTTRTFNPGNVLVLTGYSNT